MAAPVRRSLDASGVRFVVSGMLVAMALGLRTLFSHVGATAFPLYRDFCKGVLTCLAVVASVVPFALWDVVALLAVVATLVVLVRSLRGRGHVLPCLSWIALAASTTALLFVVWACNHYAPPLADEMGLEVGQYTTDELTEATKHYLRDAAAFATEVPRDGEGTLERQDFFELARIAGAAYEGPSQEWPVFEGSSAPVKALLVWGPPLLYSGHTGIFWAATAESGVPLDCAVADTPYIMCHEAAHRMGIASEQEANFAAYVACEESDDVRFRYSGAYNAFCYCLNALYRYDPDRAQQVLQEVADEGLYQGVVWLLDDREATLAHYKAYEGTFEEVGRTVNDTYLKSFGEASGVHSYGLVVDYLIAWYEERG